MTRQIENKVDDKLSSANERQRQKFTCKSSTSRAVLNCQAYAICWSVITTGHTCSKTWQWIVF